MKTRKAVGVKKISDKSTVLVAGQTNCSVVGKDWYYKDGTDCLNDCKTIPYPASYVSTFY